MEENEVKKFRKIIPILIVILLVIGFIKILPTFMSLVTEEGRMAFEEEVKSLGIKGALLIAALEICKIIFVFLPGEPIELVSGMCYGPIVGLLIMYIGIIIGNIIIISLVKKYGIKIVEEVVPKEKLEKVRGMINRHPSRSEETLFVLYFLPMMPKDFITYIASLLPISKKRFLIILLCGRFPAVFSSVLVGSKILDGDIKSIIIIYGITYLISGSIAMIYKIKSKGEKQ